MTSPTAFTDLPFGDRAVLTAGGSYGYACQAGPGTCVSVHLVTRETQQFRVDLPIRRVSEADWQRAMELRERSLAWVREPARTQLLEALSSLPRQRDFGRIEAAIADEAGRLWVKTYERYGRPGALWLVLSHSGELLGRVILPHVMQPTHITRTHVVGVLVDADGVPAVSPYRYVLP